MVVYIVDGNQRAIIGNMIIKLTETISHRMKGKADLYKSAMVVPFGATPFITNINMPKGGVVRAI